MNKHEQTTASRKGKRRRKMGKNTEVEVAAVDMWRGPIGGYGFRSGTWTATVKDGRKFKFHASIPHSDGMNEERLIEAAGLALRAGRMEWLKQ